MLIPLQSTSCSSTPFEDTMPLVGRRINATVQRLLTRASHSLSSLPSPCYWLSGSNSKAGGVGPPPPPRLLACQVACMRGGDVIIRDVNLSIHEGGAVLLMGPNGSGKSTMLRLVRHPRITKTGPRFSHDRDSAAHLTIFHMHAVIMCRSFVKCCQTRKL